MEIYVVQPNDTVYGIASKFNISSRRLMQDNDLDAPNSLVPGQAIVIAPPAQTYVTVAGDTLETIAQKNNVSQMKLLQNNPILATTPIAPDRILTIRYDTSGKISTGGYMYPYIDNNTLLKTLPNLTYNSIYNYKITVSGEIITYYDDEIVIQRSKEYGVIPLFMATTMSAQGEPDYEAVSSILSNEVYQQSFIDNSIALIKQKGYMGLNIIFNYLTLLNIDLYIALLYNLKTDLDKENLLLFVTVNSNSQYVSNELSFEKIDYSPLSPLIDGITFIQFVWGVNYGPPMPANSIALLKSLVEYVTQTMQPEKLSAGASLISYDWRLPYTPGLSYANSLSLSSALRLASDTGAVIQFDEISQSPYFNYTIANGEEHIVWTTDARTINALVELVRTYNLNGVRLWNLMFYSSPIWLVINSQFDIEKLLPSKFDV
ncbi:LysM peptidoglycan-binding domain-containing protein [Konateibacter massiliensis]|uniref:LysM peptidoglycan-binding domain-containing protein n=1 Tax=Konateibacter massiliensis TaxID=2002841 RepID=UPI000C161AB5|nr:LysM peptidoglycan-binding domain-containing protein [Konateibacter massiliensis]